jgi:ethanolamine utilization protein EutN
MYLGKVIGTVVSTSKDPSLIGSKFLIVQKLTEKLVPTGGTEVAVDSIGAGTGEIVLISKGSAARYFSMGKKESPIDAAIVGIVDSVETGD